MSLTGSCGGGGGGVDRSATRRQLLQLATARVRRQRRRRVGPTDSTTLSVFGKLHAAAVRTIITTQSPAACNGGSRIFLSYPSPLPVIPTLFSRLYRSTMANRLGLGLGLWRTVSMADRNPPFHRSSSPSSFRFLVCTSHWARHPAVAGIWGRGGDRWIDGNFKVGLK